MRALTLALVICVVAFIGCTPKVHVVKVTAKNSMTSGIRYYRPQTYLLITPVSETVTTQVNKSPVVTVKPGTKYVNLKLEHLPDFSEEYAINVKAGLGTADVEITLEDGWQLTALNQDIDSNFDENVEAATGALAAVSPPTPGVSGAQSALKSGGPTLQTVVRATNVPIGYYESVIGRDECGRKQMYGWRYLGFMPYANCPPNVCGRTAGQHCDTVQLFGLVFKDDVMEFCPIGNINQNGTELGQVEVPVETEKITVSRNFETAETTTNVGGIDFTGKYKIVDKIEVDKSSRLTR